MNDPKDTGYVPPFIDFEDEDKKKIKRKKEDRHRTVQVKRKPCL